MAVLVSADTGWVISHEKYINDLYKNTRSTNGLKSYSMDRRLFDIQVPFVKNKNCNRGNDSNEAMSPDVKTVKTAYESLLNILDFSNGSGKLKERSNDSAKVLADEFYSQLSRHPEFKFFGGNNSVEALNTEIGGESYLIPQKSLFYCYDIENVLEHLNGKEYDLILMDPPWWNKFIRRKRKKSNKLGYSMVFDQNLSNIPVNKLLHDEGIVGVWCTSAPSHINAVKEELFPAWNLEYLTQWFWLKVTKFGDPICEFSHGLGKQPFERIILGIKKDTHRRLRNPEKEKIILSIPSAIHSHKPPLHEVLKPYLPSQPKCLELFARYLLPTWTSYGNEVLKLQHLSLYTPDS